MPVDPPARIVVVGQGYVGLTLAIRAAEVGYDVVGFELDGDKVAELAEGRSHVDDVDSERLRAAVDSKRYRPTSDQAAMAGFDVAVVTVPTPLLDSAPDVSHIEEAVRAIGPHVTSDALVVLESTTYPGTTEDVMVPILEDLSGLKAGVDFHVGYSPERIDPGNTSWDFVSTPKVVSGITPASRELVSDFFDQLVDTVVAVSDTRVAELSKLLENTYRHVNIALVNELAIHAHGLGIDVWEVIDAARTKPFGYEPFWPGPGVGGHCLPIDPSYLSWHIERQLGSASRFIEIANDINSEMPAYVVLRVQRGLNERRKPVNGARILVLGLAYKKNTGDARETPARDVILGLVELGAHVRVVDDLVGPHEVDEVAPRCALDVEALRAADVVVIVTDHDDVDYDLVASEADYVFDTRNRIDGNIAERL